MIGWLKRRWVALTHDYRSEFAYEHALDDVYDHALESANPCHDRVREWIRDRKADLHNDSPIGPHR